MVYGSLLLVIVDQNAWKTEIEWQNRSRRQTESATLTQTAWRLIISGATRCIQTDNRSAKYSIVWLKATTMPMEKSNLKPIVVKPQAGLGLVVSADKSRSKNRILSFLNSIRLFPSPPSSVAALLSLITGSYSVNIFLHIWVDTRALVASWRVGESVLPPGFFKIKIPLVTDFSTLLAKIITVQNIPISAPPCLNTAVEPEVDWVIFAVPAITAEHYIFFSSRSPQVNFRIGLHPVKLSSISADSYY